MYDFEGLSTLHGPPQYQAYVKERMETLSVRESYVLTAALMRAPPRDAEETVDCLNSLADYDIIQAGNYEELGRLSLQSIKLPEDVLPYMDFEQLGQMYEDKHPGLFIGHCYVAYPKQPSPPIRQENGAPLLLDDSWSVKLKLASPAVPEGVWLRLPNYDGQVTEKSGEVMLALEELKVKSLKDCTLLDARCVLPEVGDLMKQYDSVTELVRDASQLGCVLDEQGQGEPNWLEKFAAALEYEGCDTLKFALDISQNLQCYEWASCERLAALGAEHLCLCEVPEDLIQSGCIDLRRFAKDLLESDGYKLTRDGEAYVKRNRKEFIYKHSARDSPGQDQQSGMTMQSEGMVMM